MSYSQQNGYVPVSVEALMDLVRIGVNQQFGTTYTTDTFLGTGFYKFYYALIQQVENSEVKASEIFLKLQEYIASTNLKINRPSVSYPGLLDAFDRAGFIVSTKKITNTDAGKIFICADLDSGAAGYAAKKATMAALIRDYVAAGLVSQGTEVTSLTLSNGQSFDFKFNLPTAVPVLLRLTAVTSDNNFVPVPSDTVIRQLVFSNINARYKLGLDFEPQRYISIVDLPWAASALLEYSVDAGVNWLATRRVNTYVEKVTFALGDITVTVS